ncbi:MULTISPECIES: hypothetical protein [unclassified Nodularia (in: cyanobacteria)]|uniref:hypothetical protein n=1 Tax=unclassified Nodularia (in: cyanobacteria) TaxID=2656917 RepID=UPI001882DFC1|nr:MULTISPECIES: hypothetical protein [unclassified Nodularia (in: cyanobacteria)]MBE9197956.1 hypothetical protein [Nodularia sp. LEGE 06071]MCC2691738.1 hypothetical protein [Nodularia sp. LEGE 04288]
MARLEIDDLYPSNEQQLLNEITEAEMKTVEGREGNTVTTGISDINEASLANTLDQNLDDFLFDLRSQMGTAIFGSRTLFTEVINSI